MHHVVLDRWSRGESALHRRDARAKTIAVLVFLIVLATARRSFLPLSACYLEFWWRSLWRRVCR